MGEKRKFFLTLEFYLINIEGMMKVGNQLANTTVIIVLGKN